MIIPGLALANTGSVAVRTCRPDVIANVEEYCPPSPTAPISLTLITSAPRLAIVRAVVVPVDVLGAFEILLLSVPPLTTPSRFTVPPELPTVTVFPALHVIV